MNDVSLHALDSKRPILEFSRKGEVIRLACDFIGGCDGAQGICRTSLPAGALTSYERIHPFGWFGILTDAPPSSDELIYALHERGFSLVSTRSPTVQRLYFQCDPTDKVENWPDDRIWEEFRLRLATRDGWAPKEGPITQKVIVGMRSLVTEPMQHGRVFLAGDSAHIVPPTGAKVSTSRSPTPMCSPRPSSRTTSLTRPDSLSVTPRPRCGGCGRRSGSLGG